MLLTVADWERVCARSVPERTGRPIVGVDLGAGRAWSAAVALWRSGRVEAIAVAPGLPSLEAQEKRDRVPQGLYRKLAQSGALSVAEGLRVQPPAELMRGILGRWGAPEVVICDRFRLNELRDCARSVPVMPRVTRWSEGERGYPRAPQDSRRWPPGLRGCQPAAVGGVVFGGTGQERRSRVCPARQAGHQQYRQGRCGAGAYPCRGRVRAAHVPPAPPAEVGCLRGGWRGGTGGGDETFFLLKRVNSAYEPASQNAFGHLRTTYVVVRKI